MAPRKDMDPMPVDRIERAAAPRLAGRAPAHDTETPDVETASEAYARRFSGPIGAYLLDVQRDLVMRMLPAASGAGSAAAMASSPRRSWTRATRSSSMAAPRPAPPASARS
jgi:hypothetical protein